MTDKSNIQKPMNKRNQSPSFVKLAMKNMVRKGSKSLFHLAFTGFGLLTFIVILASLGRPNIPN